MAIQTKGRCLMKTVLVRLAAGLVAAVLAAGPVSAGEADPAVLRVALLPDENAATVIQNNAGLKAYLETTLDKEIELVVTTDYSSMIEAMRFGRLELAYFGPLSYLLAKSRSDIDAFAALTKGGAQFYTGVIVARADSGITGLDDLNGREADFAFGDPASTSSHLVPRSELLKAGLDYDADYTPRHVGAHDAVALAVQNGNALAGGLSRPIYDRLVETGTIDGEVVVVIHESPPIPQYPWTYRNDLDPALKARVRDAFLNLSDPSVLGAFKADGFAPITDSDYDSLRELARILDLDLARVGG